MPAFLARWPNGDCSIVIARSREDAIIQLDEIGDEPAGLWQMKSCLIDFRLNDLGQLELEKFGEATGNFVSDKAYPELSEFLEERHLSTIGDHLDPEEGDELVLRKELVAPLVERERSKYDGHSPTPADTELGRHIQKVLGGSATYVNAVVRQGAKDRLKRP